MSCKCPLRVLVTGAAGQIAYSLVPSIAKGLVFGCDQPIILILLDITCMKEAMEGVELELQDCAFPLLTGIIVTDDVTEAFTNIDAAFLVGAMPRKEGMERKDLLKANANIFVVQGKALEQCAKKTCKILVVGNPANTNCRIAMKMAPSIPKENFSCLTRLDQNRAKAEVAIKLGIKIEDVNNIIIWGNHSSTQYPDVNHGTAGGTKIREAVNDDNYLDNNFITTVQKRGAAIIKARKLSSAMSAAKAACDHMRDWFFGTQPGEWVSMGVVSDGNPYGIPEGLVYSFPVTIKDGNWTIVAGLAIDDKSRQKMDATAKELGEEAAATEQLLAPQQKCT